MVLCPLYSSLKSPPSKRTFFPSLLGDSVYLQFTLTLKLWRFEAPICPTCPTRPRKTKLQLPSKVNAPGQSDITVLITLWILPSPRFWSDNSLSSCWLFNILPTCFVMFRRMTCLPYDVPYYKKGRVKNIVNILYGDIWLLDLSWWSHCKIYKCRITILYTSN